MVHDHIPTMDIHDHIPIIEYFTQPLLREEELRNLIEVILIMVEKNHVDHLKLVLRLDLVIKFLLLPYLR